MYSSPTGGLGKTVVLGATTGVVALPATGAAFRNIIAMSITVACAIILSGFLASKAIVRFSK